MLLDNTLPPSDVLTDPQTLGGLLVSCTPASVADVIAVFRSSQGFDATAPIGAVQGRVERRTSNSQTASARVSGLAKFPRT